MPERFTKEERSEIMRKVKSKGNSSTELRLIAYFKSKGFKGWRRNYPLPGKPDFVFSSKRLAIFADGCFWHGHNCRQLTPSQNSEYWRAKIKRNKERDEKVTRELQSKGWKVIRLWECEIKCQEMSGLDEAIMTKT